MLLVLVCIYAPERGNHLPKVDILQLPARNAA